MNVEITLIAAALILSLLITFFTLPYIVGFSLGRGYENRENRHSILGRCRGFRFGGVALILSMLVSMFFVCTMYGESLDEEMSVSIYWIVACLVLFIVGVCDDIIDVDYKLKFITQIVASLLVILSGCRIVNLDGLFGIYEIPTYASVVLTMFIVTFVVNAINFIDGIDGLAAMISISALSIYGVLFALNGTLFSSLMAFAMVGGLLPFAYYNLRGMRRFADVKIMMGDCGSLVLGLMLSVMAIKLWEIAHSSIASEVAIEYTRTLSYTMIAIPCLDAISVIVHRLATRRSIFMPDKKHIHHRLLFAGHSKHKVLLIITLMNCGYVVINSLLAMVLNIGLAYILAIDIIIWILINNIIHLQIRHKL